MSTLATTTMLCSGSYPDLVFHITLFRNIKVKGPKCSFAHSFDLVFWTLSITFFSLSWKYTEVCRCSMRKFERAQGICILSWYSIPDQHTFTSKISRKLSTVYMYRCISWEFSQDLLSLSVLTENKNTRREYSNFEKPWQITPKKPKKSKSDLAVSSISPPSPESKSCKFN